MTDELAKRRRRGRPPIPEEVQRRRLLRAAIEVFSERSYAGARISDIVRQAGMSSRSFYEFFESKEDLVEAVIHQVVGAFVTSLEEVFASTEDPIERIDRGLSAGLEIFAGGGLDVTRLSGAAGSSALEVRTHYVRRIAAMITTELEAVHAAGRIPAPPDPAAVELVITGIEGMGLRFMAEGRGAELRRLHPVLMDLLVRAFIGEPATSV